MDLSHQLGKYTLKAKLAVGGFCELWLAHHYGPMGFRRPCAIKTLKAEFINNDDARHALAAEARMLAMFDHPNLLTLQDFCQDPKTRLLYLVMPLIQGRTLSTLVNRARNTAHFGPAESLWIGEKIMHALDHIHHIHQIKSSQTEPMHTLHHDVSPQNIMIGYTGSIRLIGLGPTRTQIMSHQMKNQRGKHKIHYMSPEQAHGETELDPRSDIFSAGLILFHMLTGREAFIGDSSQVLAQDRDPRIPKPHELDDIPRELSKIIMGMLQTDRNQRLDNAQHIARQLASVRHTFYPDCTQESFKMNVEHLLHHEQQQDQDFLAMLEHDTQTTSSLYARSMETSTLGTRTTRTPARSVHPTQRSLSQNTLEMDEFNEEDVFEAVYSKQGNTAKTKEACDKESTRFQQKTTKSYVVTTRQAQRRRASTQELTPTASQEHSKASSSDTSKNTTSLHKSLHKPLHKTLHESLHKNGHPIDISKRRTEPTQEMNVDDVLQHLDSDDHKES